MPRAHSTDGTRSISSQQVCGITCTRPATHHLSQRRHITRTQRVFVSRSALTSRGIILFNREPPTQHHASTRHIFNIVYINLFAVQRAPQQQQSSNHGTRRQHPAGLPNACPGRHQDHEPAKHDSAALALRCPGRCMIGSPTISVWDISLAPVPTQDICCLCSFLDSKQ